VYTYLLAQNSTPGVIVFADSPMAEAEERELCSSADDEERKEVST
jgi:hypothetical protein